MNLRNRLLRLKRFIQRRDQFHSLGFESSAYYSFNSDCQVPNLSYLFESFIGERDDGLFVEVGANDGLFVSNSIGLVKRGWRGILFEPIPEIAQSCRANLSAYEKVEVVQCAIGAAPDSFLELIVGGPLTTFDPQMAKEFQEAYQVHQSFSGQTVRVRCSTLDTELRLFNAQPDFEVLIVDVEGYESQVFAGFSLAYWKPKLMIIELSDLHPALQTAKYRHSVLYLAILESGYIPVFKDSINTVFARADVWESHFTEN